MQYQSIRVVRPSQFDSATVQTPGSQRLAAVHPGAGIDLVMGAAKTSGADLPAARLAQSVPASNLSSNGDQDMSAITPI
jgi:hypothetical protein